MSRDARPSPEDVRGAFVRELRQFQGLGASVFRAAAGRIGMTITDMQVIDILESSGPTTAGQLADLTGLTTGAITGMLNRLEEAGLVRRERDPDDGRRVIVQLVPSQGNVRALSSIFVSLAQGWDDLAARYDDEQRIFLLDFLQRSNEVSKKELIRLQEAPADEGRVFSAPLGDIQSGRLVVPAGISRLTLRVGDGMDDLYWARFVGSVPEVKAKEGVVTIRYPRRLLALGWGQRAAEVTLSPAIPWWIVLQAGAAEITAELSSLTLAGLEIKGGIWRSRLDLPVPSDVVPIRIIGGAAEITIHRPAGVAARVHLKGWASEFVFDDHTFSALGNDVRLQSPDFDPAGPCYDIDISGSASRATITAG